MCRAYLVGVWGLESRGWGRKPLGTASSIPSETGSATRARFRLSASSSETETSEAAAELAPTPAAEEPVEAGEPEVPPAPVREVPIEPTAARATDFTLYQPGTTSHSDGTSGYTAACLQQMEDAMESSVQSPDYPFGNVDPNLTEEEIMNPGGPAGP